MGSWFCLGWYVSASQIWLGPLLRRAYVSTSKSNAADTKLWTFASDNIA